MNFLVHLILFGCVCAASLDASSYDFLSMMGLKKHTINPAAKGFSSSDHRELLPFSRAYSAKIGLVRQASTGNIRIPQVIHFIWVGPKDFPQESIQNVRSWRNLHPDWKIKLWTDREDRPCPIEGMEKILVQNYDFGIMAPFIAKSSNYGEISDLMRFKLLYDEGGFYADHDAECLKSFDAFASVFDLVVCFERPHLHTLLRSRLLPANGLIGVVPNHPALLATMDKVSKVWNSIEAKYPGNSPKEAINRVVQRTFDSFADAVKPYGADLTTRDIILPTCYFYPDRTIDKKFTQKLLKAGFVYSSHKYANAWKVPPTITSHKK